MNFMFDLGFDDKKKKTAIYRDGVLYVGVDLTGRIATVPKAQCVGILNDVAECGRRSRELERFRSFRNIARVAEVICTFSGTESGNQFSDPAAET